MTTRMRAEARHVDREHEQRLLDTMVDNPCSPSVLLVSDKSGAASPHCCAECEPTWCELESRLRL